MAGHFLCNFDLAAVSEILRDPGCSKRVIADRGLDTGITGPPLNHRPGVPSVERLFRQRERSPISRTEQGAFWVGAQARRLYVLVKIGFEVMVAGHLIYLSAFFVEP